MMRGSAWILVLLWLCVPVARADNLVINPGFESAFLPDWVQSSNGYSYTIERGTGFEPDPDYEAHVIKNTGTGWARLSQTVWIPETQVEFSVRAKLYAYATSSAWGASAIAIEYLDEAEVVLGETRIASWTTYCTWTSGPALHIMAGASNLWYDYAFNIADELQNLPAVDPAEVRYLRVSLYAQAYDC